MIRIFCLLLFLTSLAEGQSVKSPTNLISLEFKLDENARQTEIELDFFYAK
jgi:hypothetical protein